MMSPSLRYRGWIALSAACSTRSAFPVAGITQWSWSPGTMGQVTGLPSELQGPGFSMAKEAIRIPVIARAPEGVAFGRGVDEQVWTPDVTATLLKARDCRLWVPVLR